MLKHLKAYILNSKSSLLLAIVIFRSIYFYLGQNICLRNGIKQFSYHFTQPEGGRASKH